MARLLGWSQEDRDELGRWVASLVDTKSRRAAMANLYSQEGEANRVVKLLRRLFGEMHTLVQRAGGPRALPRATQWEALMEGAEGTPPIIAPIGAEPSSSESESDGD